jgi:hypothetical protein
MSHEQALLCRTLESDEGLKELDYVKDNKKHRLVYYRYRIGIEIIDE